MKMVTIYWRDIPSQVLVQVGRTKAKVQLPQRFQEAIDRAAMRAGKGSSDLYLEEWRRETCQVKAADNLQVFAEEKAQQLADDYDDELLNKLIKNKGVIPERN
ncbi:MAG: hypothetical protein CMP89_01590 [Gammaproteobacteria bacterium]|nr:hypothetical protein [Gammaproteobacteria bacterium]